MKKTGLLIAGAFLLTACDATPGGNRDVLPVVHDEAVEHVDHHAEGHDEHENKASHTEHAAETKDTANTVATHAEPTEKSAPESEDSTH